MKEIKLTQGKVALVDDEDFDFLNQWKWCAHKSYNTFYAVRSNHSKGRGQILRMHTAIMKTPEGMVVDHADRNGLNCQKFNLRTCKQSKNICNKSSAINSTSQYLGVHIVPRKSEQIRYVSQIRINKKAYHLGTFDNEISAALAYNEAAKKHHGEFANLNKIYCNPISFPDGNLLAA